MSAKLNELLKVVDITQEKLDNNDISLEDAQYVLLIVNKYLSLVE